MIVVASCLVEKWKTIRCGVFSWTSLSPYSEETETDTKERKKKYPSHNYFFLLFVSVEQQWCVCKLNFSVILLHRGEIYTHNYILNRLCACVCVLLY